jgi:hypothetical protein
MKNIKRKLLPLIIVALIISYYCYRAPYFARETSPFNHWVQSTIKDFEIEKAKEADAAYPAISFIAKNARSNKSLRFELKSAQDISRTTRLLNLASESGLKFKESTLAPDTIAKGSWQIIVKKSKSDDIFYASIKEKDLENNPAGLNLLQLMHTWTE